MGGMQDNSTCATLLLNAAMMNICRREKGDAGMTMLMIVPLEELTAELACLFKIGELAGIRRSVF